jgi:hypothetical protein
MKFNFKYLIYFVFVSLQISSICFGQSLIPSTVSNFSKFKLVNPLKILPSMIFDATLFGSSWNQLHIKECLKLNSLCLVKLPAVDPEGIELLKFASLIGQMNPHNLDPRSILWPIKYDAQAIASGIPARSQTDQEFIDHTDCSFEEKPPRLFALSVVRSDQKGGGKNEIIFSQDILNNISESSKFILRNTNFPTFIPPEFFKGIKEVSFPVLVGHDLLRYRYDCFNLEKCTDIQIKALDEFQRALTKPEIRYDIYLPENVIAFFDNARLLHSRKPILDRERFLIRARFHPIDDFLFNPPFLKIKDDVVKENK